MRISECPQCDRVPAVDRRQPALVDQPLQLGEAEALSSIGGRVSGIASRLSLRAERSNPACVTGLLRHCVARNDGDMRTAIVTGAGKRVGADIAQALLDDGWA